MSGFIDDNMPSGSEQPDTKMAVLGTAPTEKLDLVSGKPLDYITMGYCSDDMLGDTTPLPNPLGSADIPGSKNDVG